MPSKHDDKNYSFDIRDESDGIAVEVFQKSKERELFHLRTARGMKTMDDVERFVKVIKGTVPPIKI